MKISKILYKYPKTQNCSDQSNFHLNCHLLLIYIPSECFQGFVSPPPRPADKFLTLLTTFDGSTWTSIAVSLLAMPLVIFATAKVEEAVLGRNSDTVGSWSLLFNQLIIHICTN